MLCSYRDGNGIQVEPSLSGTFAAGGSESVTLTPQRCPGLEKGMWVALKVKVVGGKANLAAKNFKYDPEGPIQGYQISGTTLKNKLEWTGIDWSNFAQTIRLQPAVLERPQTIAGLVAALEGAASAKKKVRLGSSGHSWSNGVVPGTGPYTPDTYTPTATKVDAWLIDPSDLSPFGATRDPYLKAHYLEVGGTYYVAIPPGTRQGWLAYDAANSKKMGKDDDLVWYDPEEAGEQSNPHPPLAVSSMGPAPQITLGGFVANGCHGTGWEAPTVSDLVMAMEVLTVNEQGKVVPKAYAASQELADALESAGVFQSKIIAVSEDDMAALRVSLGALGVITKLVLQLEPLFKVGLLNQYAPVTRFFPDDKDPRELARLIEGCDYLEIFWFPFTDQLWIKRYKRQADGTPLRNVTKADDGVALMSQMASHAGSVTKVFLANEPSSTPTYMQFSWNAAKELLSMTPLASTDANEDLGPDEPVVDVPDAYLYQQKYFSDFLDTSWTVEISDEGGEPDLRKVMDAWSQARTLIEGMQGEGKFPVNLNIHMRFNKCSQATLSPANWGNATSHTCWIEFLSFTPIKSLLGSNAAIDVYREYHNQIVEQWAAHGGLMHWGKLFQAWAGAYADARQKLSRRPGLARFLAMRKANDPTGIFYNDFTDQVLGD